MRRVPMNVFTRNNIFEDEYHAEINIYYGGYGHQMRLSAGYGAF